ncbi:MAG TPA: acetyl-CoA C-acyltransferase [Verrucomicrobiae bacterium]|nr:acetyl-CoA C-acyltransferase [Verrucomicrobiae bacterium]
MDVYVFDAVRTPRGKGSPKGSLASVAPANLTTQLVDALRARNGAEAIAATDVFALGCVTQTGAQGGHIGLATRVQAKLPDASAVLTVNNFCVSGLSAISEATRRVALGESKLALAGGVESMSHVAFMTDNAPYYNDPKLIQHMAWAPPGLAADLLAAREGIGREALDAATLRSHQRASAAWKAGRYARRVMPIHNASGEVALAHDENVRDYNDVEALRAFKPVFADMGAAGFDAVLLSNYPDMDKLEHTHTLAHCPPISDGAALALLGTHEAGEALGLKPIARIRAFAEVGGDHVLQLTAGFRAMDLALERAGLTLKDVGAIEFMEAFAGVPVKFERDYAPDMDRVNPNGGHLAMGHPMGATGAILFAAALDSMEDLDSDLGLIVATGGVGVGAAMVLERI